MPGWVKVGLWMVAVWAVCYALNIDPFTVVGGVIHGLKQAHQASVTGR